MGSNDALKRAVDTIMKRKAAKEIPITEEEMAREIGLSPEQFVAYLQGNADTPINLASRLLSAYHIGTVMGWTTTSVRRPDFKAPKDEAEIRNNNRTSLKGIIGLIKDRGVRKGLTITEEEMAAKVEISVEQMQAYLNNEDRIPDAFTHMLLSVYQPLLNAVQQEDNRRSLMGAIVKVRNLGLSKGMDITLKEMIHKLGITGEQLYAYLSGECDLPDGLYAALQTAYKVLIKDSGQVRLREDIYLDKDDRIVKLL